jgi:20S proteasome alpha/beta subunit
MTIAINVAVPEGLVFAADSRQTYTNVRSDVRVSSDNAQKLFQLGPRHAAVTYGWAFLCNRNIHSHVNDFKTTISTDLKTEDLAKALAKYLTEQYNEHIEKEYDAPVEEKNYALALLVGGYDVGDKEGKVYEIYVPGEDAHLVQTTDSRVGAAWRGHTLVIGRLLKGYDPRLRELPGFDEDMSKALETSPLDYLVDYWSMTLQDAIDFATFLVHTTIQMQRFSDGIRNAPGMSANCGGAIEVAVIEPENGFTWMRHRTLQAQHAAILISNSES